MLTGIPLRPFDAPRPLSLAIALVLAIPATASANDYLEQLSPAQRAEFDGNSGLAMINAQYAYARGLSGSGQVLGIMDTGVSPSHPELAGRVIGLTAAGLRPDGSRCDSGTVLTGPAACFYSKGDQPSVRYLDWNSRLLAETVPGLDASLLQQFASYGRYNGHGTHVAGIMAAARNGQGMHGVAPAARVASVNLFSNVYASMENFLQLPGGVSLELEPTREVFEQGYAGLASNGVRVLNNSWGLSATAPRNVADVDAQAKQYAEVLDAIAAATRRTGMLQVWAAGNFAGATADLPAALPRYRPEVQPYWLSVVSVAVNGTLDDFSGRCGISREWCVAAPGDQIRSTIINGRANARPARDASGAVIGLEVPDQQTPTSTTAQLSGTSMAAPQVTGALALLIERFPYLNNPQVRDVLLTTATDLGAPGVDDVFGWGLINLRKAIDGPGMLRVD
ncbi:MAG TPA: S8 family peptidase, partial [Stenotrophomonas sp.]|nr:S8 family peptidase [Stenotrophomonas sp.]